MDELLTRLSVLINFAERRQRNSNRLGKTALQKLLYLLQEVYGVDLGYRFELYTYGPYEAGVMRDVDYAKSLELLSIDYDYNNGYNITPGPKAQSLDDYKEFINSKHGSLFDQLFDQFGSKNARQLELSATLVLLAKDDPDCDNDVILNRIKDIKPKYDKKELESALSELVDSNILTEARSV